MEEKKLVSPGNTEEPSAQNARRCEFDIKNEQIVFTDRQVDIDFIGDSITHFMEENQFYHKYGYVINRGIGGDHSAGIKYRFEADVLQLRPRLTIILVGANDLWGIESDIDEEECYYKAEAVDRYTNALVNDYRDLLEMAKKAGLTVWVGSLLPQGDTMPNYGMRNKLIVHINEQLKAVAKEFGTEYIDYHSNMVREDGLTIKPNSSREGIHPNHAGYELMRQVLEPMLDKYFGRTAE